MHTIIPACHNPDSTIPICPKPQSRHAPCPHPHSDPCVGKRLWKKQLQSHRLRDRCLHKQQPRREKNIPRPGYRPRDIPILPSCLPAYRPTCNHIAQRQSHYRHRPPPNYSQGMRPLSEECSSHLEPPRIPPERRPPSLPHRRSLALPLSLARRYS
jgi:hypothetical protein